MSVSCWQCRWTVRYPTAEEPLKGSKTDFLKAMRQQMQANRTFMAQMFERDWESNLKGWLNTTGPAHEDSEPDDSPAAKVGLGVCVTWRLLESESLCGSSSQSTASTRMSIRPCAPYGLVRGGVSLLWQEELADFGSFGLFSSFLEQQLHDTMHDTFGGPGTKTAYPNGGTMSWVPSSGFDPIFFLHHCQVDRLYTLWQVPFAFATCQ